MDILKNLGISMLISLILLFIFSIILSTTNISESIIGIGVIFITSFSILIGSFCVGKKKKEKGILYGSVLGLIYMLIIYTISSILNSNFNFTAEMLIMCLVGIIGGAVGGILGVNLK